MRKALLICLCIVLSLLGGITGLTSFLSEAQAQGSGIIVEEAEYVSPNTTAYSADLIDVSKNVTRLVVEYGESISKLDLNKSDDLNLPAGAVSSRIVVEYADSIFAHNLQNVMFPDIAARIIFEYADSAFTNNLVRPSAPLTSPPVTNISLNGVHGLESWFTSDVEVNLVANVPVEKTEYSFDNATWITYSAPFTITNEGYNSIYYRSIDKAGNVEITKTETVKIDKTYPTPVVLNTPSSITTLSAILTWSRNNDPDFLCYQIVWSVEPLEPSIGLIDNTHYFEEMSATLIYDQSVASYHLKGLSSSTRYYFLVRTFKKQGIYCDSNQISITTQRSATIPLPPWSLISIGFVALISICRLVIIHRLSVSARAKHLWSHPNVWRVLMAGIIFGLGLFYPEVPSEAPWFWIGFFFILGTPLLWSALEQSSVWGFIFGMSLGARGFIYWNINLARGSFLIGLIIYCGLCAGLGSLGGWVVSKWGRGKTVLPPTYAPAPSRASTRSLLAKLIRCRKCGRAIPDTDKYCVYCGVRIKRRIF